MQYTVKSESLIRAKERACDAGSEADPFLNELLDLSAGIDSNGVRHFRPYYSAALWLEQSPQIQMLSQADEAVFTQMVTAIASLKALQASYDLAYALSIPPGFESVVQKTRSHLFNTSTLPVVVVP